MLFNSYIFILAFFPLAVLGWYLINRLGQYKAAEVFLIGMSLWFYGYFNRSYLLIICVSIVVNYVISIFIRKSVLAGRKIITTVGITLNVLALFYYKYYDFFIGNINHLFNTGFAFKNIVLPLGISFFTFQQISFLADTYNGEDTKSDFIEYALFVSFFPQLIAGPIVSFDEMIPQLRDRARRTVDYDRVSKGLYLFAIGLFKKVMVADFLANAVDYGYKTVIDLSSLECWIVSICYTLQLYYDFSGYCDMAMGIGQVFNLELPYNFDSPYKALSIPEFWKRWHMSLTRFLTKYVYIPLGGSRKGKIRTYINIMIVFCVSGLWHGANWTFILWGALHGVFNCLGRMTEKVWNKVFRPVRWFVTFNIVSALLVIFRADDVMSAVRILKRMLIFKTTDVRTAIYDSFKSAEIQFMENRIPALRNFSGTYPGIYLWISIIICLLSVLFLKNAKERKFSPTIGRMLLTVVLITISVISFSGVSKFLYFNF